MERYLVILPHTPEECIKTIRQVETIGTVTHFDWGCKDGEHCGWVIIEADSKAEASMVVPAFQRTKARVVKLTRFSPEEITKMHQTA